MSAAAESASPLWKRDKLIYLGWECLASHVTELKRRIQAEFQPTWIVAICRGGLVPATLLSHALAIRSVAVMGISRNASDARYSSRGAPQLEHWRPPPGCRGQRLLLVDDIVGDGGTMRAALQALEPAEPAEVRSAVVVKNVRATVLPHYFALEVDDWVVFPWEGDGQ